MFISVNIPRSSEEIIGFICAKQKYSPQEIMSPQNRCQIKKLTDVFVNHLNEFMSCILNKFFLVISNNFCRYVSCSSLTLMIFNVNLTVKH